MSNGVLLLSRRDVEKVLSLDDCIDAVENAFATAAHPPSSLSVHVDGGAFHVKAATESRYFAVKCNGNFFANPERGLPRIQGLIMLCDATNGTPLALFDSMFITILRTGAATGVAARQLAPRDAKTLLVSGCGNQGRVSIDAVRRVRSIERVFLYDVDPARAAGLAREVGGEAVDRIVDADISVLCTPSKEAYFSNAKRGSFVAAVGADSSEKLEVAPELMKRAAVVVDDLEQCATFGDLRGAIAANLMTRDDVSATLREVITGAKRVEGDVIIFDSTGTALQDVAAASIAYERAVQRGLGGRYEFAG